MTPIKKDRLFSTFIYVSHGKQWEPYKAFLPLGLLNSWHHQSSLGLALHQRLTEHQ